VSVEIEPSDGALWKAVVQAEGRFIAARMAFLANAEDRVGVLRGALHTAAQRGTALRLLPYCQPAERQELFGVLLRLSSVGHRDVLLCREAILSLPRGWVLDRIESAAEELLSDGGEEEYRRLLELYAELDAGLTRRLAERAARHPDQEVREAGADFLRRLP
jgi:hypothetical protein